MDEPHDSADGSRSYEEPGDISYKTETLRRGNDDMRRRIAELRDTLQHERAKLRDAHSDKLLSLKRQRDMGEQEKAMSLEEQKTKLLEEKRAELRSIQQKLQQQQEDKLREILRKREADEVKKREREGRERATHEQSLRQLAHEEASEEMQASMGIEIETLRAQLQDAAQHRLHLERLLANKTAADNEKAEQIRSLLEDLNKDRTSISRENQLASKQEMLERKRKDADIKKLEEEMSVLRRNYDRVEADRSKLNEELTRRRTADSLARRTPQKIKPGMGIYDPGLTGSLAGSPAGASPGLASPRQDNADKLRIVELSRELREIKAKVALLEVENENLQQTANTPRKADPAAGDRITELTKRNTDLLNQLRRSQAHEKELDTRVKEQDEQVRQLQDDLRKARVELSKRTERPTPTKLAAPSGKENALQAQLQQQTALCTALQEQVAERDRRIEALKRDQRDSQQTISSLQERVKQAASAGAAASAPAPAVDDNGHRILVKENVQLQQQISRLRQSQSASKELDGLKKDAAQLRAKCTALQEELQAAQTSLNSAQNDLRDLRAGRVQSQGAQAELAQLRGKVDVSNAEKQRLAAEVKTLTEQLNGLHDLEQQVCDLEVEREELRDELNSANKRILTLEKSATATTPLRAAAAAAESDEKVQHKLEDSVGRSKDEDAKRKKAEEAARAEQEAAVKRAEEEQKKKAEEQRKQSEEAAQKKKAEEDAQRKKAEEVAAQKKAGEEAQRKAEEAAQKKKAEEDAQRKKAEEVAAQKKAEEEAQKKKAEEIALKKKADEEAQRKQAEEAAQKKNAEDEALRKKAEEVAAQKKAEEEAQKKAAEKKAAEELRKKAEEEEQETLSKQAEQTKAKAAVAAAPAEEEEEIPEEPEYEDDFEEAEPATRPLDDIREEEDEEQAAGDLDISLRGPVSFYQATYDYNPEEGPNENEDGAELGFCEQEVLAIFGDADDDGFFMGQNRFGVRGLVPSNYVQEIDMMTARTESPELFEAVQEHLPAPEPPKHVDVERSAESYLLIAWTKPADINMLEGYRIIIDGEVKAEIPGADATLGRAPMSLKPGQTYKITVVSFTRLAQSAPSQPCIYTHKPAASASSAPVASAAPAAVAAPAAPAAAAATAPLPTAQAATSVKDVAAKSEPAKSEPAKSEPAKNEPAKVNNKEATLANNKEVAAPAVASQAVAAPVAAPAAPAADDLGNPDIWKQRQRLFLVLYSYDPSAESPNIDDYNDELKLDEGQIVTVYGELGEDGFYYGEHRGKRGMIPSNMVEEMPAPGIAGANALLSNGNHAAAAASDEGEGEDGEDEEEEEGELPQDAPFPPGTIAKAMYDYEPTEMSPNEEQCDEELPFREGDLLKIISGYDEDGFYMAEHKATGQKGLVPHNFIELHSKPKKKIVKGLLGSLSRKLGLKK